MSCSCLSVSKSTLHASVQRVNALWILAYIRSLTNCRMTTQEPVCLIPRRRSSSSKVKCSVSCSRRVFSDTIFRNSERCRRISISSSDSWLPVTGFPLLLDVASAGQRERKRERNFAVAPTHSKKLRHKRTRTSHSRCFTTCKMARETNDNWDEVNLCDNWSHVFLRFFFSEVCRCFSFSETFSSTLDVVVTVSVTASLFSSPC